MSARRGFTLVELLVVVSIIAILSVIGITIFTNTQKSARDAKRKADIDAIFKAYEAKFDGVNGIYKVLEDKDFTAGKIPQDSGGKTYSGLLTQNSSSFKICAALDDYPGTSCNTPRDNCYCKSSVQGTLVSGGASSLNHPPTCDPNGILDDGLVAYWKMDEASWTGAAGEVKDTASTNHGTALNGASTIVGKFGNGGNFDGSNDFVEVNSSVGNMGINPFSVSFWAKHGLPPAGYHVILGKKDGGWSDPGWLFSARSDGLIIFYVNRDLRNEQDTTIKSAQANINTSFPQDSWYHIVGVRQDQILYLYLNGQLAMQRNHINFGGDIDSPISLKLGALPAGWGHWAGQLDDVRIYNRALSENEIQSLSSGCIP